MIEQTRIDSMRSMLDSSIGKYDEKEAKKIDSDVLYRMLDKIHDLHNINKGEINKLVMLLEYTIVSLDKRDLKGYKHRYNILKGHLNKYFGVYFKGELQSMGIAIGIALGTGIGVAIGAALGNTALGIPIGTGVGISLGVGIGTSKEKTYNEQGRII